jgi:hypothetical protein
MPVCVAGMHRSGTSMLAKLLHLSGIHLGPDEHFLPPSKDNPEGYWEDQRFVQLNERVLEALNGSWYCPPAFDPGWESRPGIAPLLDQAAGLLEGLKTAAPWGWKDPRNSITLPFWQRLLPDLQVVIAVRNPLEVAQSLHQRDHFSYSHGLSLWLLYYRRLLAWSPAAQRVLTHYDAYFAEPEAELQRVLDILHLSIGRADTELAHAAIAPALKRNRVTTADMQDAGLSEEVSECYRDLCAQAGPHYRKLEQQPAVQGASGLGVALRHALHLEAELRDSVHHLGLQRQQQKEREDYISALLTHIAAREKEIDELRQTQRWKRYVIADRLAACYWNIRHPLRGLARARDAERLPHGRR